MFFVSAEEPLLPISDSVNGQNQVQEAANHLVCLTECVFMFWVDVVAEIWLPLGLLYLALGAEDTILIHHRSEYSDANMDV